eukprot:scaffold69_cov248-Pinguiococcus_pyrenoidosus.AAC.33
MISAFRKNPGKKGRFSGEVRLALDFNASIRELWPIPGSHWRWSSSSPKLSLRGALRRKDI